MDEKTKKLPHTLIIEDRKRLNVTGVTDVDNFDEEGITLYTSYGQVAIKGEDIQVSVLNTENGDVLAEGKIISVTYSDKTEKRPSLLSRVFR